MQSFPYLSDLVRALTGWDLPLPIPMLGLSIVVATLVAGMAMRRELRRLWADGQLAAGREGPHVVTSQEGLEEWVTGFVVWMLLAGIAGSRLFSLAEDPQGLLDHPADLIFSRNGFNVIGGFVVATVVGVLLVRRAGLRVAAAMDAAGPAMMLGYALGRVGCQVSGDGDWGVTADMALKPSLLPTWFWAQTYEGNIAGVSIAAPGVYPTPVWETLAGLVLFAVLWRLRRHPFRKGWLFAMFMVLAAVERLLVEPLRVNERYGPFDASQAQYLSAVFLVLGLVALAVLTRRRSEPDLEPRDEMGLDPSGEVLPPAGDEEQADDEQQPPTEELKRPLVP